jgi:methylated-DNA-[protein]-cysteine S-methyltransferase
MMADTFHVLISTPFGNVALVWSMVNKSAKICRVILSNEEHPAEELLKRSFPGSHAHSCPEVKELALGIKRFLCGGDIRFDLDVLLMDSCSSFQSEVLRIEHIVPRGWVTTYQRIGVKLGRPRSSRAVGQALAHNPFPILIPCHRAARTDLTPGGFQGGVAMKRALLALEGVEFTADGRIGSRRLF